MKITPIEIRQKTFEKKLRGYDKDEVTAFLLSLSQAWEKLNDENKELRIKLEMAERDVKKMREVETSLFKTLKTAEDTGATLIEQANRSADLHLKEVQMKADVILSEAKSRAKTMIEDAENRSKNTLLSLQNEVKELERNYKDIESYRDNLISDLKHFANDLLEKVNRAGAKKSTSDPFSKEQRGSKKMKAEEEEKQEEKVQHTEQAPANEHNQSKSFFDNLEM